MWFWLSYDTKRIQTIGNSQNVKDIKPELNSENQDFVSNGNKIIGPELVFSDPSLKKNDTAPKAAVSTSCKESCPAIKRPICGMRPKTFKNKCMIKCLNKDKKKETKTQIIIAHKGKCVSGREYAIPQKDGVGSFSQIAVPGYPEEKLSAKGLEQPKKLKDMTSDEREEYQYEADVRNVTELLG